MVSVLVFADNVLCNSTHSVTAYSGAHCNIWEGAERGPGSVVAVFFCLVTAVIRQHGCTSENCLCPGPSVQLWSMPITPTGILTVPVCLSLSLPAPPPLAC